MAMHDEPLARRMIRIGWFVAVGLGATLVHLAVVVALVRWRGWNPLPANVAGWLTAFACSFWGHWLRTFERSVLHPAVSARRFLVISALGFVANQAAYGFLMKYTGMRYDLAVIAVSAFVAGATYLLSLHWAFRGTAARG